MAIFALVSLTETVFGVTDAAGPKQRGLFYKKRKKHPSGFQCINDRAPLGCRAVISPVSGWSYTAHTKNAK